VMIEVWEEREERKLKVRKIEEEMKRYGLSRRKKKGLKE
jgi:hypothetical protein